MFLFHYTFSWFLSLLYLFADFLVSPESMLRIYYLLSAMEILSLRWNSIRFFGFQLCIY